MTNDYSLIPIKKSHRRSHPWLLSFGIYLSLSGTACGGRTISDETASQDEAKGTAGASPTTGESLSENFIAPQPLGPPLAQEAPTDCESTPVLNDVYGCSTDSVCDTGTYSVSCGAHRDRYSCTCDTPMGSTELSIRNLTGDGICTFFSEYCKSGQHYSPTRATCESLVDEQGTDYCRLETSCLSGTTTGDGVMVDWPQHDAVTCQRDGSQWLCQCTDSWGSPQSLHFALSEDTQSPCHQARKDCATQ